MPFADSRRLTGSNLFFDSAGAVLDVAADLVDDALLDGWRSRVERAREWLGWPHDTPESAGGPRPSRRAIARAGVLAIRRHGSGASLAVAAPQDQLFTATELNEWAWCAALVACDPLRWNQLGALLVIAARQAATDAAEALAPGERTPMQMAFAPALPVIEERGALARLQTLSRVEGTPRLRALIEAAHSRDLLDVLDEEALTLGSGRSGQTWALGSLPRVDEVSWSALQAVPSALVTGSNGKTTTVRLLAACARAQGFLDGFNCTDGVFIAGEQVESGDYSGPAGTRRVLRDPRVEMAILETARGGILRRGLAAGRARVAVVTNVSADHFGEYGIHDLAGLADVKLVVASAIDEKGLLILNADDPVLRERATELSCPIGWFSIDDDHPLLRTHRQGGGQTSGVRDGRLVVSRAAGTAVDLGHIERMPLTVDGTASYNIANVAGAALAALALGIPAGIVSQVLARFGASPADNPGRLMRFEYRGARVLVDYAHNPEGLSGLLEIAVRLRGTGRIAVLVGQAGNRETRDIERLAETAARFRPDRVVIKELENYLRGRAPGEVPGIIRAALLRAGMPEASMEVSLTEMDAVRRALQWARPGDVIVLPVHDRVARTQTLELLTA